MSVSGRWSWRTGGVLVSVMLAACENPEAARDAAFKVALSGTWSLAWRDAPASPNSGVTQLMDDGSFSTKLRRTGGDGRALEVQTGLWYVTDGLLKLHITQIDGQGLGTNKMRYSTCKLGDVSKHGFDCVDQLAMRTLSYQKVPEGSEPP